MSEAPRDKYRNRPALAHRDSSACWLALAERTRDIRSEIAAALALEPPTGQLRQLLRRLRAALSSELSEENFADECAQALACVLLAAEFCRSAGVPAADIVRLLPYANPFLQELLTGFARRANHCLGDLTAALDDLNLSPQDDPLLQFYELFLRAYEPAQRRQRGVYYTPQPVVSYIVRSVHELLQQEFGLADGLADVTTWGQWRERHPGVALPAGLSAAQPFVQLLDPATGTGTFLVEAIDLIHHTLTAKWTGQGLTPAQQLAAWTDYVPRHLLPRLHGYEIALASYAIAHVKLGLKLFETGYQLAGSEPLGVHLTNALEPPPAAARHESLRPALTPETLAVHQLKRQGRFTVVVGNPPYSLLSANLTPAARAWVEPYREIDGVRVRERGALKAEVILQDDYLKFLALTQAAVRASGAGIVGLITNANCYLNPVLRGVRHSLLQTFQQVFGLDLGGQSKAGHAADENVFEIDTGVAVSLFIRREGAACRQRFGTLRGSKAFKLGQLARLTCRTAALHDSQPGPSQYLFMAGGAEYESEYRTFFPLDKMFHVSSIGIKSARDHLVLDFDREVLEERLNCLRNPAFSDAQLRDRFRIRDNTQWSFEAARTEFVRTFDAAHFTPVAVRPFDTRWIYFHPSLVFNTRPTVNRHLHGRKNLCLLAMRRIRTAAYQHFFVTNRIAMGEILSSADNCHFFPLYLYRQAAADKEATRTSNLTSEFVNRFAEVLAAAGEGTELTPDSIFQYAYAVLHSPAYRERYAPLLRLDFPRLPLTSRPELFRELASCGARLIGLHLLESLDIDPQLAAPFGSANLVIERVAYDAGTVWLDRARTGGFGNVPPGAWDFAIGSYRICEKWLKDRKGRQLSPDDIQRYRQLVSAVSETRRRMAEIDGLINRHGGWPGAFAELTE